MEAVEAVAPTRAVAAVVAEEEAVVAEEEVISTVEVVVVCPHSMAKAKRARVAITR
jgi:hypothetical protein